MKVTTLWQQKITLSTVPSAEEVKRTVLPLMTNAQSFGVDLEEAGFADTVIRLLREELAGAGALRETLKKYAD